MSGGTWNYFQYRLSDVCNDLEDIIKNSKLPRPPQRTVKFCSIYEILGEGWKRCKETCYDDDFRTKCMIRRFDDKERFEELEPKEGSRFFKEKETGREFELRQGSFNEDIPDLEGFNYEPDYSKETLKVMANAIKYLKNSQIIIHRLDWLLAGDDGNDSFIQRLKDELGEDYNKIINN